MTKKHLRHLGLTTLFATGIALAPAAHANLILNGSFESPAVVSAVKWDNYCVGAPATCAGQTRPIMSIDNWTVVNGSLYPASGMAAGSHVSIVHDTLVSGAFTFPAADGDQWLDLTGTVTNARAGVQQVVNGLTIGATYVLSYMIGNVSGGAFGTQSAVDVYVNGGVLGQDINSTASTSLSWLTYTREFTATQTSATIAFMNRDGVNDNSNGLDAVSLVQRVPEPGAMLLAALALLAIGVTSRSRRS